MNHLNAQRRRRLGGMSAKVFALPMAVLIALLQVTIIILIIVANLQNANLSRTITDYSRYESDASQLVAGASVLNGTATAYVQQPNKNDTGALLGYANELRDHPERRPDAIAGRFDEYGVGPEAKRHIDLAKTVALEMIDIQKHAIALMLSAYPSSDVLTGLELPPLTEAEEAMTVEEKTAEAVNLLTNPSYTGRMGKVSENVTNGVQALRDESDEIVMNGIQSVRRIRIALLATTSVYSVLLLSTFLVLYFLMVSPLDRFVRGIAADRHLDEDKGLYEVRRLAHSYNALLSRRESLETVLRFAAETDPLTNLPNRYRFEQYFYDSGKTGYSVAFLVFDVNHLKETNDRMGHLAGDELIKNAAECIRDCFGIPGENNCFRIGGDEFAAIVKRVSQAEMDRRLEWFADRQKEMKVSVAVGLAYAEEIGDADFRDMFLNADRNMYSDKMREHGERKAYGT